MDLQPLIKCCLNSIATGDPYYIANLWYYLSNESMYFERYKDLSPIEGRFWSLVWWCQGDAELFNDTLLASIQPKLRKLWPKDNRSFFLLVTVLSSCKTLIFVSHCSIHIKWTYLGAPMVPIEVLDRLILSMTGSSLSRVIYMFCDLWYCIIRISTS